jgi:hypothetical protein
VAALAVNILGMVQSVSRYVSLPLAALGVVLGWRRNWQVAALMLATVIYYLGPGTFAHTELRYVLPMHCVLSVFAGFGCAFISQALSRGRSRIQTGN